MEKTMSDAEFNRRSEDDFKFMVLCESKGNNAMYRLLQDTELVAEQARRAAERKMK